MPESGGPTTQSGIFYQNTVAARALVGLLDLSPLPQHERIVEVRVEAPAHIDDVVVGYADGHRDWIRQSFHSRPPGTCGVSCGEI